MRSGPASRRTPSSRRALPRLLVRASGRTPSSSNRRRRPVSSECQAGVGEPLLHLPSYLDRDYLIAIETRGKVKILTPKFYIYPLL
jgi:hypothetical protein